MSSKQPANKPDPRIAKKDVIVTRRKSAQMKRQLRVKDRSMKHITDLLKSPTKETHKSVQTKTKSPPKLKQSLLKSIEKVQKLPEKVFRLSKVLRKKVAPVRDEEYYPNKRKRKVEVNRVVLKPVHDLKLVGGITGSVKRKYAVPHKASKSSSSKPSSPVYAELSMSEVLQIMEDDLTDEDMMEILTCPSPVWWEDPPDEEYIEEAIFRRTPEPPEIQKQPVEEKIEVDVDKPIEVTNLNARGDKFLKKRSKLEDLLGNIKNKTNNKVRQSDRSAFNDDLVVLCSGYRKNENNRQTDEAKSAGRRQTSSESDDDLFQDSSMNVDDFLNELESMEIPIEDTQTEVIVIEDDDECKIEQKKRVKKDVVKMKSGSDETLNVLKTVPVLKKYRLEKLASPKSFESASSKTSGDKDVDSISDTNVKFLLDEELDVHNNKVNINDKQERNNREIFQVNKEPFVNEKATYGIIKDSVENSKEVNDVRSDEKEKMNDYYKTCKKATQKKITAKVNEVENTDRNKNDLTQDSVTVKIETDTFMLCETCKPQIKKVSDDKNVKYCLKCSSIFDSTDCAYCIEKSKSNIYKCVSCKLKFCCEAYFNVHTMSHLEVGLET